MPTLGKVLNEIEELSIDDQEFIEEELHNRIALKRREMLVKQCKQVDKEYKAGNFKTGTAKDLLRDLND